jgi:hypothetical protein
MEGLMDMFLQDGTKEHIIEKYKFENSGISITVQQMENENAQFAVGVPLVVWGASLSLSRWLDKEWIALSHEKGRPLKSLELGSGTGLLGLFTIKRLL